MSDVINAHDLGIAGGYIIEAAMQGDIDQLKAENAKLRELLSVMAYCNQFRCDCDGCSMNGAAGIITERAGCDELLDRMRELGIEVS